MFKYIFGIFSGLGVIGILSYVVLLLLMIIGYFMNLWDLIGMGLGGAFLTETGLFILRIIGAFVAPLGGLLGWFA